MAVHSFVIVAAIVSAVFYTSAALAQNTPRCETPAPEFTLTDANRIGARELGPMLRDRTMLLVRRMVRSGKVVWYERLTRELRGDGSIVHGCEYGPSPEGPWNACTKTSSPATGAVVQGGREIGTWTLQGSYFCYAWVNLDSGKPACFSIHRSGNKLYAKRTVSVPSCTEGDFTLVATNPHGRR